MKKSYQMLAALAVSPLFAALALAQENVYISSSSNVSDYTNPALSGNVLLFDTAGVTLTVDQSVSVNKIAVWGGTTVNAAINTGNTFTVSSLTGTGFNLGDSSSVMNISGAGTLSGSLRVYSGTGSLNVSSNMDASNIYMATASKITYSGTGGKIWNNGLVSGKTYNTNVNISGGGSAVATTYEITGSAKIGDIYLSNNAHLILNTTDLTMNGQFKDIEVNASTIELTRGARTSAYTISSKIRLNGASTMILNGENAYTGITNILFMNGTSNTVYVNDQTDLSSFVIYNNGTTSAVRTLNIVLGNKEASDAYILKLTHFTTVAGTGLAILKTDSLTTADNSVTTDTIFIKFDNFALNTVMVTNGLLTAADWSHITADGWENFHIDENGYLAATAVPEPAAFAAIFGVLALGFAAWRRRRQ